MNRIITPTIGDNYWMEHAKPFAKRLLCTPKQLQKFQHELFKRYYSKNKIVFTWEDMVHLTAWMSSRQFQNSTEPISVHPFLDNAVFYMEFCYDEKSGEQIPPTDPKMQPNIGQGIIFDRIGDDDYLFKVINPDTETKGVAYKHFIEFATTDHTYYSDPAKVPEGGTSPQGLTPDKVSGTFNMLKRNGRYIEVIDADFRGQPDVNFKGLANDIFQAWAMCNYFLLNFSREVVVYDYQGKGVLEGMPDKTKKQRARKQAIVLGKVYRCRVTEEWVERIKREYDYKQTGGNRHGGWVVRRVRDDYWERYPERIDQPNLYRVPTEARLHEHLRYATPLRDGWIFIEVCIDEYPWKRNKDLLVGDIGFKANTYKF